MYYSTHTYRWLDVFLPGVLVLELLQQAIEGGDSEEALSALLLPSSGVEDVVPANASHYLHLLTQAQRRKAQVCVIDMGVQKL